MTTSDLTSADFSAFFKAIWGVEPFPWQQRLLEELADGEPSGWWPDVLDLPTGAGKTSTLDIAVFHLALEAARGAARRAPLRIALVVDRRLIVDDAFVRATRLAEALRKALEGPGTANPAVLRVATALGGLAGTSHHPLVVRRLRGGAPLEEDWAHTPVQPTILCSTVDQVGSRLLFRGYGVSDRMKPIHAGLLGADCLLLLDEAHLSEPFRQTLAAMSSFRGPDASPFGFTLLTATPGISDKRTFGLGATDYTHAILSKRIKASKPARLIEISSRQGADGESSRAEQTVSAALSMLQTLATTASTPPVIAVVANRVARARMVFELICREEPNADAVLLIGPARSVERGKLVDKLAPIRTGESQARSELPRPMIVIATQTIEAGVDLDFDGLITEAAPLDALRQRFGRLNRAGRSIVPAAAILASRSDIGTKADDVIYGNRIAKTWDALRRLAGDSGIVDFGIDALRERFTGVETQELAAPRSEAPVLMPAYVDLWSQTSPIPSADPEVALFLHGPDMSPASVEIVWRADILDHELHPARKSDRSRIVERLRAIPPRAAEAIQVSLWAARAWLTQTDLRQVELSDAVERTIEQDEQERTGRPAFCWAGPDSERTGVVHATDLRPGDFIVVPCSYGGCDEWGWNPTGDGAASDVADLAQWPYRSGRYAVRITPELVVQGLRQEMSTEQPMERQEQDIEAVATELTEALDRHGGDTPLRLLEAMTDLRLPQGMIGALTALSKRKGRLEAVYPYGSDSKERPRGIIFLTRRGLNDTSGQPPSGVASTETEEGSATASQTISLVMHSRDVRDWAKSFANAAGLEESVAADVALASFLHDAGKSDPRYQAYLAGGDPYGPDIDEVLAKSGNLRPNRDAWRSAGLPDNWRHEALSVRLACLHPDFKSANDSELVLWLIGTHHGLGRPLFPHSDGKDSETRLDLLKAFGIDHDLPPGHGPQSLAFEFDGSDWHQIFMRLKRRYGVWGLARLEGFVRLADHRASEAGTGPHGATIGRRDGRA